jgi:transcriptional regulator with XRE-family HTH domain
VSENYPLTGRQIAAARALAGLDQVTLAERARVSIATLRRMEASDGEASGYRNNVEAVRRALEAAGVEFTNGSEPGVKLKAKPQSIAGEDLNASNDE